MSLKSRVLSARPVLAAERLVARAIVGGTSRRDGTSGTPRHLLLAAPSGGSVGDQAMFEAFVHHCVGDVTVIARGHQSLRIPPEIAARTTVLAAPHLLYGSGRGYLSDLRAFREQLAGSASFSVIGADVMDGEYNARASVRRFMLADLAAAAGVPSRILGFSWNAHPVPAARRAMRRTSTTARLIARDPTSARRLVADGASAVADSADLAFLSVSGTVPPAVSSWIARQRAAGRRIVIVNANYLLERFVDQVAVLAGLVRDGEAAGVSFIVLPHDSRSNPSDETLAAGIAARTADLGDSVLLVPTVLDPSEVVAIAGRVDFAISGRMHLAILAAVGGAPTVAVSYQGKIEGLYARLGLSCFVLPDADFAASLRQAFDELSAGLDSAHAALAVGVPALRAMAQQNVDGLDR